MVRAISTFALFAIAVIGVAVPVYVLVCSFLNFRRAKKGRGHIVLKAFASLAAWVIASFITFNVLFFTFYTAGRGEANASGVALRLIIICVVFALAGYGVAFWSQHRADNEPIQIFSKGAT